MGLIKMKDLGLVVVRVEGFQLCHGTLRRFRQFTASLEHIGTEQSVLIGIPPFVPPPLSSPLGFREPLPIALKQVTVALPPVLLAAPSLCISPLACFHLPSQHDSEFNTVT